MEEEDRTLGSLTDAIEKWSAIALAADWVSSWIPGAIFPCELVFFLASCEVAGVRRIIESGRQDGYSTKAIGTYVQLNDGLAYSIDLETDQKRAKLCREQLAGNPNLSLLKGNAKRLIGPLLFSDVQSTTAVLIDGPKGFTAMGVLLASVGLPNVAVAAMHNLNPNTRERALFERISSGIRFYEELENNSGLNWMKLRDLEIEICGGKQTGRLVNLSSLGVLPLKGVNRWKLFTRVHPCFGRHQPLRYFTRWKLGSLL